MSNTLKPPIVVFGGNFNPPTVAHVLVVAYVLSRFSDGWVDMRVMPVFKHAHSKKMLSFTTRLAMVRRAMEPFGDNVTVSNFEAIHKPKNTLEMVQQLKKSNPGRRVMLVVGADCYRDRESWHRWDLLEKEITILVIGREGVDLGELAQGLPITLPAISSTDARTYAAAGDYQRLLSIVPTAVFDQIRMSGHYGYK